MKRQIFIYICISLVLACFTVIGQAQTLVNGSVIGRHIYGLASDYQGDPLIIQGIPLIYGNSGYETAIQINNRHFLLSVFNSEIASAFLTDINSENSQPSDTQVIDLASVAGLSSPQQGMLTAWNSMLLPESVVVNGADYKDFESSFKPYFKGKSSMLNPYNYGWVSELIVLDEKGASKAIKNYSLGRLAAQQLILMPDAKSAYLIDKLGNLYVFVAEQANSLSKGRLYAVVAADKEGSSPKLQSLGDQSALKIKFYLKNAAFGSIFKAETPNNGQCHNKFTFVTTIFGEECLSIQRKYKKYAAYFEPLRYLAMNHWSALLKQDSKMVFDEQANRLVFSHAGQDYLSLSLGKNQTLNSQYIVKEQL